MRAIQHVSARLRDERGVSAVIVVLSLTAILGASMLSVDAGSLWRSRRGIITGTDAAALAAARAVDAGGSAACSAAVVAGTASPAGTEASSVLGLNDTRATFEEFVVEPYGGTCTSKAGRVRVDARVPVNLTFAGALGIEDVSAFSSSTAQYGPLVTTTGLRPIALCDKSPHLVEWATHQSGGGGLGSGAGHPNYGGAIVHRVYFQKGSSGCGTASGNWDWLDFNENAGPNGNSALREWLLDGYPGVVSLGDTATGIPRDCNGDEPGNQEGCAPKTGAGGGSFTSSLEFLRDTKLVFPIIVFDRVVDERDAAGCSTPPPWTASGSNARFCPVAFLLVRVHGWDKITGNLADNSYFDFEFVDQWWHGRVGVDPSGSRPTVHGVQLCGGNYGTQIDLKCDV